MSYLLETLRRLEEQRQQDNGSDLLRVQGMAARPRRKRPLWPYLFSAALLLNAGVAVWWLVPLKSDRGTVTVHPPVAPAAPAATPGPEAVPKAEKAPTAGARSEAGGATPHPRAVQVEALPPQTGREGRGAARPSARRLLPDSPKPARGGAVAERSGTGDPTAAVDKDGLPALKISLHSYGPARESRLVRINDQTLREGEMLSPGIKVEEITPDGIILSREGKRFHVGIDQER